MSDDELELGSLSGGDMVPVVGNSLVMTVDWRELVVILRQLSESEILETVAEPSEETQAYYNEHKTYTSLQRCLKEKLL